MSHPNTRPGPPARRRHQWQLLVAGCLAMAACSRTHEKAHVPDTAHGIITPTTNVPALLDASIDGLRQRLGPPQALPAPVRQAFAANKNLVTADSMTAFRTGGLTLIANYDASTRQVHDLLLLGHHEDSLMGRASLRANAGNYILLPVFRDGQASQLMGLRVVAVE